MNPIRGSTASSAIPGPRAHVTPPGPPPGDLAAEGPRRALGNALRAVGVFLDTAFRVVVLGSDGTRQPDAPAGPAREKRTAR